MTEQREAIEELSGNALKQLNGNLQAAVESELSITESVMASHYAALRRTLVRISKLVLLYYLALAGGGILGLWGIGIVWDWRIESGREEHDKIMASVAAQTAYLLEVEKKSGGIGYVVQEPAPHLRLPPGSVPKKLNREEWIVLLPKR